jgi:putative transposase
MDKSAANKSAIDEINDAMEVKILIRQVKYLNNIVEQDHRAVKRITKPMFRFKSFHAAKSILAGIKLVHIIRKAQLTFAGAEEMSFADKFFAFAGKIRLA